MGIGSAIVASRGFTFYRQNWLVEQKTSTEEESGRLTFSVTRQPFTRNAEPRGSLARLRMVVQIQINVPMLVMAFSE